MLQLDYSFDLICRGCIFCNLNTDKLSKNMNKEPSCRMREVFPAAEKATCGFSVLVAKEAKLDLL
ncbi:hypothetical protein I79_002274 [Cricetulus griseus]|uniref:Uncharacterized protein n=1 Tax=Cricetulus griseus TaxID=10029 RepID=G3GWY7_CRIGR|nr:hypothetical protein I79_002274 [Cricetulus griseus]